MSNIDRAQVIARAKYFMERHAQGERVEDFLICDLLSLVAAEGEARAQPVEMLVAARDVLAAFGKQAGWVPGQQGYSTRMTDAEMRLAQSVADLDSLIAQLTPADSPQPQQDAADTPYVQLAERIARQAHYGQKELSTGDDYVRPRREGEPA